MKPHFSFYIHLIRIFAAVGVFLAHLSLNYFSNVDYFSDSNGHYCVVIFFVLSGYLIAFTQEKGQKNAISYSIDRLSRLYSVVLPALILTYLLDGVGFYFNPVFYNQFMNLEYQWLKFIINLLHAQQIVFFNTNPSSNKAFWSLSYEFWYYVFYGCVVFLKGYIRILSILLVSFIMGYKILILLPVWLIGVLTHYIIKRFSILNNIAIILFVSSFLLLFLLFFFNIRPFPVYWKLGFPPFFYSSYFPNDYFYGIVISFNLWSLYYVKLEFFKLNEKINSIVKFLSAATFPLYAFHYPLLVFIGAVVPYDKGNVWHIALIISCILGFVLILNYFLDMSRKYYVLFFARVLERIKIN